MLVIDDEPDIREIARVALERVGGWDVVTADGGRAGVAAAAGGAIDAILLDVSMPGIDGLATAALLRQQDESRHVPIILLTASPGAGDVASEFEIAGTLRKPFDPMQLAAQVSSALRW